jgi:hypothetical protein
VLVGHLAVALTASKASRVTSLAWLMFAANLVDLKGSGAVDFGYPALSRGTASTGSNGPQVVREDLGQDEGHAEWTTMAIA